MSWRKRFLLWFGPSTLGGITFGDWLALLRENRFAVDPSYWLRATTITLCSLGNSLDRRREERPRMDKRSATLSWNRRSLCSESGERHHASPESLRRRRAFRLSQLVSGRLPALIPGHRGQRSKFLGFFIPETRVQDNIQIRPHVPGGRRVRPLHHLGPLALDELDLPPAGRTLCPLRDSARTSPRLRSPYGRPCSSNSSRSWPASMASRSFSSPHSIPGESGSFSTSFPRPNSSTSTEIPTPFFNRRVIPCGRR